LRFAGTDHGCSAEFSGGSVEQNNAIVNLRNTTRILMQRDWCLG
jgi:hypothetical protein